MEKNKKKVIITMIMIVSIITFFFVSKNIINKKYEKLPEVRLKEIKRGKSFAIMVSTDLGDYKRYNEDNWPGDGYVYNKSECVDNSGKRIENVITYEEETKTVILETDKTVSCTLYFDKTILGKLRENDPNKVISSELVGDLYRYQGTYDKVNNNYICFGTDDIETCKNNEDKYMYRIIGIDKDEHLKLIKKTNIKDGENNMFSWNSVGKANDCSNKRCEWPNVDIYKRINGISNGNGNNTDIFVDNPNYEYLKSGDKINGNNVPSTWYNLIENHNWLYGDMYFGIYPTAELNGETIYGARNNGIILWQIETGQLSTQHYEKVNDNYEIEKYEWKNYVSAKIGLMYLHDYYLAYDNIRNWVSEYDNKSWIYKENNFENSNSNFEFLMTRLGYDIDNDFKTAVSRVDGVIWYTPMINTNFVRPVFYIKNDIKINGKGTKEEPYIIMQKNEEGKYYYDYGYTGDVQTFTAPEEGTYKIELWGASGGTASSYVPGKGAYTKGEIKLKKDEKLYIYIGEEGKSGMVSYLPTYNGGGGTGFRSPSGSGLGGTGGGATDVRLDKGEWNNFDSLKSRIMVAAGGGAAGSRGSNNGDGNGGAGGTLVGIEGQAINNTGMYYGYGIAYGGTQTSAGKTTWINGTNTTLPENYNPDIIVGGFGYAGIIWGTDCYVDCQPRNNLNWIQYGSQTGGGGGYYGGASTLHAGAAGGSSYISGYDGCKAIAKESTESKITHLTTSEHYSGKVFTNTVMLAGNQDMPNYNGGTITGNTGNGHARITKIS